LVWAKPGGKNESVKGQKRGKERESMLVLGVQDRDQRGTFEEVWRQKAVCRAASVETCKGILKRNTDVAYKGVA